MHVQMHSGAPAAERNEALLNYLNRLRWDKAPRLDTWLTEFLGVEDSEYSRSVGSRWLLSAVARAVTPGVRVDGVLVLVGKPGAGKSSALQTLGGDWFRDGLLDMDSREVASHLKNAWICEIAELRTVRQDRAKAFISATADEYRPYGARDRVRQPRGCVFAVTTNDPSFPADGRRFLRLTTGAVRGIDVRGLASARDQLLAEAYLRCLAGERFWLEAEEMPDARTVEP